MKKIKIFLFLLPIALLGIQFVPIDSTPYKDRITNVKYRPEFNIKKEFKPPHKDYKNLFLVDLDSNKILYNHKGFEMCEIASITKMVSILLFMEAIDEGKISLTDTLKASTASSKIGGSQIYLREYEKMIVEDLLKSVIIKSANDATYLLAETVSDSGTIKNFVHSMNERAKELGMDHSVFYFAHGLPATYGERKKYGIRGNLSTCYDLTLLAEKLIKYPLVMKYSSTWLDSIRKDQPKKVFQLRNTSRLIKDYPYFTGLKTGFYDRAGFCIVATANKDGRNLVAVSLGSRRWENRDKLVHDLMMWGFDQIEYTDSLANAVDTIKVVEDRIASED
ncbi:MAG: hypothetical protein CSA15_03270 [Candidatus Delongbacteria bacterium]|nr:MAG: hypothetical protein CSA15_03270 [Candidatus Delongbacteria bacterium]